MTGHPRTSRMSRNFLIVGAIVLGALLAQTDPAFAERRVALVIGNSAYRNAPVLPNGRRDGAAMAAMFKQAGFDVVEAASDADVAQLNKAVARFADEAAQADIAVAYFSGYGLDIGGVNYLIPVDAKLADGADAGSEAIALDAVAKAVNQAKRLRLFILDASHSDPFASAKQKRGGAPQDAYRALAEPDPKPGSLIAYAALAESESEDGAGEHSFYSAALLRNLFTPGLDIRLAFGRVLVDVLKNTDKRQNPLVYGSLTGANIALVPAPADRPAMDLQGEKTDYGVVEQIGSVRAWEVFLVQHPTGFYSTDARVQLRAAATQPDKSQPSLSDDQIAWDKVKNSGDIDAFRDFVRDYPSSGFAEAARKNVDRLAALEEQVAPAPPPPPVAAAPPGVMPVPEKSSAPTEQVASLQRELTRLGCYTGATDGTMDAETTAALRAYRSARGLPLIDEAAINDGLIDELKTQTAPVCKSQPAAPVAHNKEPDVAKPQRPERPVVVARPPAAPRPPVASQSHGPKVGVGF
jgi:Caspase domain/Putative peptidoglycan binding domain